MLHSDRELPACDRELLEPIFEAFLWHLSYVFRPDDGSFALNRILGAELVGVSPADPLSLAVASAVLILAAALGCSIPARRALRVDPVVALRHE